jgi:hypothetical protein
VNDRAPESEEVAHVRVSEATGGDQGVAGESST